VVATAVGGIPELVVDGRTGILVPVDDAEAMAGALAKLMDDPALAASMGRAARQRAVDRHSFDRMTRAFEDLYLTQLESRASVRSRSELVAS
jgi:glycosyltransferase involved in cell wall biosynthesis